MRLRLLTWNLRHGLGMDQRLDLARIAEEIAALAPDLVAAQEVDAYQPRSGQANQWRELGRRLGHSAFYGSNVTSLAPEPLPGRPGRWARQYGNAVLTRLPVRAVENHLLTYRAEGDGYKEQRGCLEVETEVATFLATHLGLHADERRRQTGDLRTLAKRAHGPAVILGDLNADPESPELGALRARFLDAGCDAGPTIPSRDPARRIDYCLLPPAWRVVEARVVPTEASDHRPLLVVAETGE